MSCRRFSSSSLRAAARRCASRNSAPGEVARTVGTPLPPFEDAGARRETCRLHTERGLRRSRWAAGCAVDGGLGDASELSLAFSVTLWKTKSVNRLLVWWRADWISADLVSGYFQLLTGNLGQGVCNRLLCIFFGEVYIAGKTRRAFFLTEGFHGLFFTPSLDVDLLWGKRHIAMSSVDHAMSGLMLGWRDGRPSWRSEASILMYLIHS